MHFHTSAGAAREIMKINHGREQLNGFLLPADQTTRNFEGIMANKLVRSVRRWWSGGQPATEFAGDSLHYARDYNRHVTHLTKTTDSLDKAMSIAVGGNFAAMGQIQSDLLRMLGLRDGMRVLDVGCGSGRGAIALARDFKIDYHGIDVVQALLDYAKANTPAHYRYSRVEQIEIPDADASTDMVVAFSLFTHLLHEETYRYLQECVRVLKPGGRLVFSFLEFAMPAHWHVFEGTIYESTQPKRTHLNVFIERPAIEAWAQHLGLVIEGWQDSKQGACIPLSRSVVTDGGDKLEGAANLGQSVCVLRKN